MEKRWFAEFEISEKGNPIIVFEYAKKGHYPIDHSDLLDWFEPEYVEAVENGKRKSLYLSKVDQSYYQAQGIMMSQD